MEAVGFIGGAFTLAGVATLMAQWRQHRTFMAWAAAMAILGLVMLASAVVVLAQPKAVAPAAPTTAATAPASGIQAVTSYQDLLALTPAQQVSVMQRVVDHRSQVLKAAFAGLDTSHLAEVTSGTALTDLTNEIAQLKQARTPLGGQLVLTVTEVNPERPSPRVVVHVVGTDKSWYLDPKTGQADSGTRSVDISQLMTVVWGGGQWKVDSVENVSAPSSPAS